MKLEDVIEIAAAPDVVWEVTTDVECWPEWMPTVSSVRRVDHGPFSVGSAAWIKQPALPETKWTVTSLAPGERFTWETQVRGMLMVATHEIMPAGAGTRNVLRLEITGFAGRLMWPLLGRSVRRSLEQENRGLKQRCEAVAAR